MLLWPYMTRMFALYALLLCLVSHVAKAEVCADIDTYACVLLQQTRTDLCSDPNIANFVCKSYCGNCPMQCYHCGNPVLHPTCDTNTTCTTGQTCGIKEIKSADGRHEYTFGCIDKLVCDGSGFGVNFGRRDVDKRDISIHCCNTDFCNTGTLTTVTKRPVAMTTVPVITTTARPSCNKKVLFVIDERGGISMLKHFVKDTVTALDIDNSTTQVGIASFDENLHNKIHIYSNGSLAEVLKAINSIHPEEHVEESYVFHQLDNLVQHSKDHDVDAVVIVTKQLHNYDYNHLTSRLTDLNHHVNNLIHVEVGSSIQRQDQYFHHVVQLETGTTYTAAKVQELVNVICV